MRVLKALYSILGSYRLLFLVELESAEHLEKSLILCLQQSVGSDGFLCSFLHWLGIDRCISAQVGQSCSNSKLAMASYTHKCIFSCSTNFLQVVSQLFSQRCHYCLSINRKLLCLLSIKLHISKCLAKDRQEVHGFLAWHCHFVSYAEVDGTYRVEEGILLSDRLSIDDYVFNLIECLFAMLPGLGEQLADNKLTEAVDQRNCYLQMLAADLVNIVTDSLVRIFTVWILRHLISTSVWKNCRDN